MELTEEFIKNHSDYKKHVSNNNGVEDPNLVNFCLETAEYSLKIPHLQEGEEYFQLWVIENNERVIKTIEREEITFDNYSQLLEHALEVCQNHYFALHSLDGNTLRYFKIDGNINFTIPMEDKEAEAVVKQVHRNNIISQI